MLNLSDLAGDVGISPVTAKHWLSILETSDIIYLLEPYHINVTKRLIKSPKLHFLDTGLAAYLTEWTSPETLEAGAMSGNILETFIFTEILKSYWHNGKEAPLHYYRDKDKKEIDLLSYKIILSILLNVKKQVFRALIPYVTLKYWKILICLLGMEPLFVYVKHYYLLPNKFKPYLFFHYRANCKTHLLVKIALFKPNCMHSFRPNPTL